MLPWFLGQWSLSPLLLPNSSQYFSQFVPYCQANSNQHCESTMARCGISMTSQISSQWPFTVHTHPTTRELHSTVQYGINSWVSFTPIVLYRAPIRYLNLRTETIGLLRKHIVLLLWKIIGVIVTGCFLSQNIQFGFSVFRWGTGVYDKKEWQDKPHSQHVIHHHGNLCYNFNKRQIALTVRSVIFGNPTLLQLRTRKGCCQPKIVTFPFYINLTFSLFVNRLTESH